MSDDIRQLAWKKALFDFQERMKKHQNWYPIPALISFGLVTLFSSHLLPGLNPRLGSHAEVLTFPAAHQNDGAIWLGVYIKERQINVVTDDRRKFTWPISDSNVADTRILIQYLKNRVKKRVFTAGRGLEAKLLDTQAVIAADRHLKYIHIRPIIYALAAAKINRYGFETKVVNTGGIDRKE